jgi:hypothetical protein
MRSAGVTKSLPPFVVTRFTKSTIDCFALPSFQEGKASAARAAPIASASMQASALAIRFRKREVFIALPVNGPETQRAAPAIAASAALR